MSYKYAFDPIALEEYHEAIAWYGQRSIAAMEHFEADVAQAIAKICQSPLTYKKLFLNFRETSLQKFPFSIVFHAYDAKNIIIITSIYHHSRNPNRKYKK